MLAVICNVENQQRWIVVHKSRLPTRLKCYWRKILFDVEVVCDDLCYML